MQSTDQVCEHQNANYLVMMRERNAARAGLAAERDRAEARIAEAPHQLGCACAWQSTGKTVCTCWKSEATA